MKTETSSERVQLALLLEDGQIRICTDLGGSLADYEQQVLAWHQRTPGSSIVVRAVTTTIVSTEWTPVTVKESHA